MGRDGTAFAHIDQKPYVIGRERRERVNSTTLCFPCVDRVNGNGTLFRKELDYE
jgi:hypothetical protein